MTRSQALAAARRAVLPALLAGGAVLALVLVLLLARDPSYEARVGIAATPVSGPTVSDPEYGAVVSSLMPALPEVAVSSPVVDRLSTQVPGLDGTALAEHVAVELVPASGVARVTVTGATPEETTTVLRAVVEEIVDSDLLAPVGTFTVIGDVDGQVTRVGPDPRLAVGLGALAAAVTGLLVIAAVQVLRPRLLTVPDVERVVRSVLTPAVPVVAVGRGERGLDLVALRLAAAVPGVQRVVAFPAGRGAEDGVARAIEQRLAGRSSQREADGGPRPALDSRPVLDGQPVKDPRHRPRYADDGEPAIVVAQLRRTSAEDLTTALLDAAGSGHEVGAVVAR